MLSTIKSFLAPLLATTILTMGGGLLNSLLSINMSLTIWSGLLFQWPVGLLSDHLDRLTVLSIVGFLVMLVSVSIATLGALSLGVLLLLTACFGVVFTIYPVAMARAQDNIEKEDIVPVSTLDPRGDPDGFVEKKDDGE